MRFTNKMTSIPHYYLKSMGEDSPSSPYQFTGITYYVFPRDASFHATWHLYKHCNIISNSLVTKLLCSHLQLHMRIKSPQ